MNRHYVHVGSRTISYLDSAPGTDTSRILVLIHAFPLAASMWDPQLKAPPPGWRLIAPDLRGFGGSPLVETDAVPSIDDYAADVVDLVTELGVTRAVIGGLSLGGYVTFAVWRRAPALVTGIVLADTRAGADTLEARGNRRTLMALLDREGPSSVGRGLMPKLLGATTRLERPELESSIRQTIKQQSPAAIREAIVRLMGRPDSTPLLSSIGVPALIIVGRDDEITPISEAQRMADMIRESELLVIPSSGHLSSLERPEEFSSALAGFLSRL